MVIAFGSIAGCPKGTPKTTPKTDGAGGGGSTSGPGVTKSEAPSKDWVKATPEKASFDLKAKDGEKVTFKIAIERGDGDKVKDKEVEITFTVPKDKGIKDIDKITVAKDKKEVEVTVAVSKEAEFKADVDITFEAMVKDVPKASGKVTIVKK
jgi:hypothetical protein